MLFVTPFMWGAGASVVLRDKLGPDANGLHHLERSSCSAEENEAATLRGSLHTSISGQMPPHRAPPCAPQSQAPSPCSGVEWTPSMHNLLFYCVPFLVGMLPNFMAKAGLLPDFSLSARSIPEWGIQQLLAVSICALMLVHLLGYHGLRAYQDGQLTIFASFYGFMLFALVCTVVVLRPTHHFHMHHYYTAALLVPLTRFTGPVSAVWQGMLVGFQLQGVAVYGFEPLFCRIIDFGP